MRRTLTLLVSALAGALIAALVVVAVPAEGAPNGGGPGDPLLLSRVNQAGPMTVLKTNGGFRILAKDPKRPPLMIYSPDSMPPLDVSSTAKVENLNVDLLDGLDSSAFLGKSAKAADANLLDGLDSAAFSAAGHTHDDRYYTETEADSRFVGTSDLLAAYSGGDQNITVPTTSTVVRSVSLTPPSDGTVIVNSSARVYEATAYEGASCSITTGTGFDSAYEVGWDSGGLGGGTSGVLAGTRGFSVTRGASFTARLVCYHWGGGTSSSIQDSSLTAIFIPNP